ncbi:MAG: zinc ribbon domain-containing protein [Thermoplasmata archaeon]
MSRVRPSPLHARSGAANARRLAVVALTVLLLGGSILIAPVSHAPVRVAPVPRDSAPSMPISSAAPACGSSPSAPNDLVVGPGTGPCVIEAPGRGTLITQSGNVTVLPGGTLIVRNVTFSIQQFVSNTGTPMQRLSHIYAFRDEGSVQFWNATLTTAAGGSDPYIKLNLNVTGQMTVWNSSFEFPGWIDVYGPGATLTLNESTIEANPAANTTSYESLGPTIVGDTSYAASISAAAGAQLVLLNSSCVDTYADNTQSNGLPGPVPLSDTTVFQLTPALGRTLHTFETPTDSLSMIQDWLYPDGIYGGIVSLAYSTQSSGVTSQVSVTYNGSNYPLGTVNFGAGSTLPAQIPFSSALVAAINSEGMLAYLNLTGSFPGTGPSEISVTLTPTSIGTVNISLAQITLGPLLQFNLVDSGPGTTLTLAGSLLDLNWNQAPTSPVSQSPPFPWDSNKLLLEDGAHAYLAGLIIPTPNPGPTATSAVLPDLSSNAYVFRWAAFSVAGRGGIPVPDARALAYYATGGGTTNVTVNALNDLSSSDPILWGYVQSWDAARGISSYGVTSATGPNPGVGYLLLVSDNITEAALPSSVFLGSYNAKIVPPIPGVATASFAFSLTQYPGGLTNDSPELAPATHFPQYAAGLLIGSLSFTIDGVPSTASVHIGQTLGVQIPLQNTGTAPVANLSATLTYQPPSGGSTVVSVLPLTNESIPSNATSAIDLSWKVSESVIGDIGAISATLAIGVVWNGGPSIGDGGSVAVSVPVRILPSYVRIASLPAYPHLLQPETTYSSSGTITFNGTGAAAVSLAAYPLGGGAAVRLATASSALGNFTLAFNSSALQAGILYSFGLNASYNTAFAPSTVLPGNYSLVAAPVPELAITSITTTANGIGPVSSVRIGQILGVTVVLFNDGTGATTNLSGILLFVAPGSGPGTLIATLPLINASISAGQGYGVNFTWTVTERVIGDVGPVSASLLATFAWNGGLVPFGGGVVNASVPIHVQPSDVRIVTFQPYPSTLQVHSNYTSPGTISFNGSGEAFIELIAAPVGGAAFVLAETNASVGMFNLTLSSSRLLPGIVYNLSIEASYNTALAPVYGAAGIVSLASGGSSASSNDLWLGIAIGVAAAGAVLVLLLLLRRGRKSEMQECGECGSLVAANEETCPRCGTWFETEPIPCPSCGAAIPADVGICPACATEAPDRPTVVHASEADRQAYEEFVSHYRAAAAGELGEDYPEADFWAWWKQQPSYYSFRAWRKREERDSHPVEPPVDPEPSDEELF